MRKTKKVTLKKCVSCPQDVANKTEENFYVSYSSVHSDGRVPICKNCIADKAYDEHTDDISIDKFKQILRQIDKPFSDELWRMATTSYNKTYGMAKQERGSKKRIIGLYFKYLNSLPQYRSLTWVDEMANPSPVWQKKEYSDDNFEMTNEIISLFGEGFKNEKMYRAMWNKYNKLKDTYVNFTDAHKEALATYVRNKVREEFATAEGKADEAKTWGAEAAKWAKLAMITPEQLSKNNLLGGLTSFSELSLAVEQAIDVVPILPQFMYRPNDAPDFVIWCYVNYMRRLEDKPECDYQDVYEFYTRRRDEYKEQYGDPYGIFEGDTTDKNHDAITNFIKIPKIEIPIVSDDEDDTEG